MRALKGSLRLFLVLSAIFALAGPISALPHSPTLDPPSALSFLHLTDLHIDPDYKINSTTYSQCHRVPSTFKKGLAKEFGMLGTDCDAPPELIKSAMDLIKSKWGRGAPSGDQARVVIWTGDSARHDRDPTVPMSNKFVLDHNQIAVDLMRDTFDADVTVVPNIGNHDVHPANHMSPPPPLAKMLAQINSTSDGSKHQHFLALLLNIWHPLLFSPRFPWEHANITRDFLTFGSFVKTVVPGQGGLSVVSLNTLWYFPSNDGGSKCKFSKDWKDLIRDFSNAGTSPMEIPPWQIKQDNETGKWTVDVPSMLAGKSPRKTKKLTVSSASLLWLHNILLAARGSKSGVMIQGHIPPQGNFGPLWHKSCTSWFTELVGGFMKDGTVSGFWAGHTNEDGFSFVVRNTLKLGSTRRQKYKDLDPTIGSEYRALALSTLTAPELLKPSTEIAGVFYTSPSLVPARNPSFRAGELLRNGQWRVGGWTQWALDLGMANKLGKAEWGVEYDTKTEYGLGVRPGMKLMRQSSAGLDNEDDEEDAGLSGKAWRGFIAKYAKNTRNVRELYETFKDVEGDLRPGL